MDFQYNLFWCIDSFEGSLLYLGSQKDSRKGVFFISSLVFFLVSFGNTVVSKRRQKGVCNVILTTLDINFVSGVVRMDRYCVEGAKPSFMTKYKQKGFISNTLNSFVALPLLVSSLSGINPDIAGVTNNLNSSVFSEVSTSEILISEEARKIDAYFADRDMPLAGMGEVFVREARANNIDPFLVAAISVRESTGGRHACKSVTHSFLGWGSCKINFSSAEEAIRIVSWNLGGNNPNTARYYANKTTKQILDRYNPPTIVEHYTPQVMKIMDTMRNYSI